MTAGADGNKRKPRLGENDIPLVRQVEYHFPLSAVVFFDLLVAVVVLCYIKHNTNQYIRDSAG